MRYIDAVLNSSVFWGVVFLVLLLFGSRMEGIVRAIAFTLSWLAGSYGFYRWWSVSTAQDARLLASFLLCYSGFLLFLYFWTDQLRPVSRLVNSEPVGRGTLVASASLLDVGASPAQEQIANPPDWVAPKATMQLIFQDSPLLTNEIKDRVTEDLSAFREYFLRLGIPVSDEFPSIGVGNGPGSSQAHISESLPSYRSNVAITRGWFVNRRAITAQYADYAIAETLRRRPTREAGGSVLQDTIAGAALSQYYNWSFWNYKPKAEGGYWSSQLWEIRSAFGKDFTDRLLAFTIRSMLDSPDEGADPNFDIYFHHKLQQGDSVIDSDPERMAKITDIIEKSGINLTTPKAYFDFSATAVKRHDGSFVLDILATNKSDVPANHGQFRMYFAPDVQLLTQPKGSLKDSSTTLKSARLIPFESISAHTSSKLNVEFRLISGSFSSDIKSFIVHFDYQCETCGSDSYSHDLRFALNVFDAND